MMITIVTCWDGSNAVYNVDYVNKLYRSALRYSNIPFEFVLHLGPEGEKPGRLRGLESAIKPVPVGLPSWWSSMAAFKQNPPGVETNDLLFLDLDIVIVGSLDDLILYNSQLALMKDYPARFCPSGCETHGNTGITLIRSGAGAKVWDEYIKAGKPTWDALNHNNCKRSLPLATMTIINDPQHNIKKDLFPENWVCSYKLQAQKYGLPEDCRIVHFHGKPKQHEVNDAWIKEHWT